MRLSVEITIWDKYALSLVYIRITVNSNGISWPGIRTQLIS